jgi:hypothetical protein
MELERIAIDQDSKKAKRFESLLRVFVNAPGETAVKPSSCISAFGICGLGWSFVRRLSDVLIFGLQSDALQPAIVVVFAASNRRLP